MNTHSIDLIRYCARSRGNSTIYLGTAGSHGNEQLQVTLGKGWEGLTVQVVFHPCKVAVQLPANGVLDVPWEATAQPLTMMQGRIVFQGFDQDRLVNSTDLAYTVASHSPALGRDEEPYTPGIVEGVLNQMAADKDAILSAAQQANQAKEAAAASAAEAAVSAANAQQSAGAANTSAGQAAASASQAAGSAAAAGETLTRVQTAGQEAQQKVKDAEIEALDKIASAAPALPSVSNDTAWQSVTVKPDGTGYNLAAMAPIESAIRPTVTGNPAVCENSAAWGLQGLKIYGKSTQDGTPSPENPVPIVSAGDSGSVELKVTGANLIRTHGSQTINGVTFIDNDDGTITANGTATSTANYFLALNTQPYGFYPKLTTYYMHGCPFGGSTDKYAFQWDNPKGNGSVGYDFGSGLTVEVETLGVEWNIAISVKAGFTADNLVFKPMVNYGNNALPFEPYREQSLAFSNPNGMPGIPVESGGNYTDSIGRQWICDEINFSKGKKITRIQSVTITPASNLYTATGKDLLSFALKLPSFAFNTSGDTVKTKWFCDTYKISTEGLVGSSENEAAGIYNQNQMSTLFINDRRFSTVEEYKTWLTNNPVTILYALASPIESDITAEEMASYRALTAYDGTTVVSTAEPVAGIEAQYIMDGNKYRESVDKRLAALEAAQTGI